MNEPLRLVGLSADPALGKFRTRPSRFAGLFRALETHVDVQDVLVPRPSTTALTISRALAFHPDRTAWRGRANLSPFLFRARTASAERLLAPRDGSYDVVLQRQSLFAPGTRFRERRFAVYSDNSYALTRRHHRAWAPLAARADARWLANERLVAAHAGVYFANSEFLRTSLVEDYGVEPERAVRVGAGCNSLAGTLDGRRWDGGVALFVGANWTVKGGPTLLDAWRLVRERLREAELWIVGPREPHAPEQAGVRWLGFVGDRDELARIYAQASVFVLPSYFEAWGHVLVEAMGHGLPCAGTRVGAMPELVEHERSGLLVEPGEAEPLAEALVALLGDAERAERLGRRGYDRVLEDLTWKHVAARMAPHLDALRG